MLPGEDGQSRLLGRRSSQSDGAESVASNESMVVHHTGGDNEPLSLKECIQAYLHKRIPELESHVNRQISVHTEALKRQVDDEFVEQALRRGSQACENDSRTRNLML